MGSAARLEGLRALQFMIHNSSFTIRRGFTLLELLTIVAIIGLMATVGIMGLNAGKGAARLRGAARDIFATVRQARSVALVTQQPAIISYGEKMVDEEICASVQINAAKMMNGSGPQYAETLAGERIALYETDETPAEGEAAASGDAGGGGLSSEDFFFAPISDEVVKGVRIKVTMGEERVESDSVRDDTYKPAISVFSNVDYLLGRFKEAKKKQQESEAAAAEETSSSSPAAPAASSELQSDVHIVWEVNGRCEPHNIWIFSEGKQPDSGLCIKVDRFGGAKIISSDEF